MKWRLWVLMGAVSVAVAIVFLFPAIPQNEAYHNFADDRALLGIPNCLDGGCVRPSASRIALRLTFGVSRHTISRAVPFA